MSTVVADPLFPALEPYEQGWLDVGDGHRLYFEQCGNSAGLPLVVLHGGPGSGCTPRQRRFFDPAVYRVILFDQRGSGRSTPRGELVANTTAHLVADVEALRRHLGIDRWLLFGGSWGSSLAIACAAAHPAACLGMLLRGIFLTGRADLDWFFRDAGQFLPEAWTRLAALAPGRHPLYHCARVLANDDRVAAQAAVGAWVDYEEAAMRFGTDSAATPPPATSPDEADRLIDKYRVQAHYLVRRCFLGERRLLDLARRCGNIPAALLHGRRDIVCRPSNAWRLRLTMAHSRLQFIEDAGHNPFDPAMATALVTATSRFAAIGHFGGPS